jgi:hypothetical protein
MKLIIHAEGDFNSDVASVKAQIVNYLNATMTNAQYSIQFVERNA